MADYSNGYMLNSNKNPWFQKFELSGDHHFQNGYETAEFAFELVFLVLFIGMAIWIFTIRKHTDAARSVMKFTKFGLAVMFTLMWFIFRAILFILSEAGASVENVFLPIDIIISSTYYLGIIFLLVTAYSLAFHLLNTSDEKGGSSKRTILLVHYALCGLFVVFVVAFVATSIAFNVYVVDESSMQEGFFTSDGVPVLNVLDVTFDAMTAAATLELLLGSIWGTIRSRKDRNTRPMIFFIALVALPFLLNRLYSLGYDAHTELTDSLYSWNWGSELASDLITNAAKLVAFVGIGVVVKELDKTHDVVPSWSNGFPDQTSQHALANGFSQSGQAQSYPDQQQFIYHPEEAQRGAGAPGHDPSIGHGSNGSSHTMDSPPVGHDRVLEV